MSKTEMHGLSFGLIERQLASGGFSEWPNTPYRTDSTAWATLALSENAFADAVNRARSCLAQSQLKDGRVCISDDHPQAFWPTPLAVLAWHGSPLHRDNQERAIQFMLQTTGSHFEKNPKLPFAHDTALRGWPWIENTFSWIVPTASALLALKLCDYSLAAGRCLDSYQSVVATIFNRGNCHAIYDGTVQKRFYHGASGRAGSGDETERS